MPGVDVETVLAFLGKVQSDDDLIVSDARVCALLQKAFVHAVLMQTGDEFRKGFAHPESG